MELGIDGRFVLRQESLTRDDPTDDNQVALRYRQSLGLRFAEDENVPGGCSHRSGRRVEGAIAFQPKGALCRISGQRAARTSDREPVVVAVPDVSRRGL